MKVKMMFGMVMSALLAYGVLRLVGFFAGTVTALDMSAEILLAALYLAAFRAAAVGKPEAPVPVDLEQTIVWEEEEIVVPAAA